MIRFRPINLNDNSLVIKNSLADSVAELAQATLIIEGYTEKDSLEKESCVVFGFFPNTHVSIFLNKILSLEDCPRVQRMLFDVLETLKHPIFRTVVSSEDENTVNFLLAVGWSNDGIIKKYTRVGDVFVHGVILSFEGEYNGLIWGRKEENKVEDNTSADVGAKLISNTEYFSEVFAPAYAELIN
jgi:hypothetical protein